MNAWSIRKATAHDAASLFDLITQLAVYEKLEHEVVSTPEAIGTALQRGHAHALIAEPDGDTTAEQLLDFALYFYKYSTFTGTPVLHLEDLFVPEEWRSQGIGKALLLHVAGIARSEGCARMEWNVLDWNESAIAFYESIGGRLHRDWLLVRLDRDALTRLP